MKAPGINFVYASMIIVLCLFLGNCVRTIYLIEEAGGLRSVIVGAGKAMKSISKEINEPGH